MRLPEPSNSVNLGKTQDAFFLLASRAYMVGSSFFSVHRASHIHPARHRVNAEDFHRRLVGSHSSDAVPDMDLFVLIGTNLDETTKTAINKFWTKAIWMFKQL